MRKLIVPFSTFLHHALKVNLPSLPTSNKLQPDAPPVEVATFGNRFGRAAG